MIPKDQVIESYLLNEKKVIAEMLYDTIEKYEKQIKDLQTKVGYWKLPFKKQCEATK